MAETSASLLERLQAQPDGEPWERMVRLYTPLVRGWLRRQSALAQDADDVVQEVLQTVVRKLPDFQRERTGSFRAWLRQITVNCLRDHWRRSKKAGRGAGGDQVQGVLDQLADPQSALSKLWEAEHDQHVMQHLLELIRPAFASNTWQAFQRVALQGANPDEVAAELGLTVNAVFIAKSRVLSRLRQEAAGLID